MQVAACYGGGLVKIRGGRGRKRDGCIGDGEYPSVVKKKKKREGRGRILLGEGERGEGEKMLRSLRLSDSCGGRGERKLFHGMRLTLINFLPTVGGKKGKGRNRAMT